MGNKVLSRQIPLPAALAYRSTAANRTLSSPRPGRVGWSPQSVFALWSRGCRLRNWPRRGLRQRCRLRFQGRANRPPSPFGGHGRSGEVARGKPERVRATRADVGPAEGDSTCRQGKAGHWGGLGYARRLPRGALRRGRPRRQVRAPGQARTGNPPQRTRELASARTASRPAALGGAWRSQPWVTRLNGGGPMIWMPPFLLAEACTRPMSTGPASMPRLSSLATGSLASQ